MPCIYYYVPPCPVCGSKNTGYYKRMTDDSGWTSKEGLKHGEIVRETTEVTDNNAFCEECGFEWSQQIKPIIISRKSRMDMMQEKGLLARLDAMKEQHTKEYEEYKKEHPFMARYKAVGIKRRKIIYELYRFIREQTSLPYNAKRRRCKPQGYRT